MAPLSSHIIALQLNLTPETPNVIKLMNLQGETSKIGSRWMDREIRFLEIDQSKAIILQLKNKLKKD